MLFICIFHPCFKRLSAHVLHDLIQCVLVRVIITYPLPQPRAIRREAPFTEMELIVVPRSSNFRPRWPRPTRNSILLKCRGTARIVSNRCSSYIHRTRTKSDAMDSIPPTSLRPQSIFNRPDPNGTIYVETNTIMPPPAQAPGQPHPDLAGVLRRNQACLNCRRRKLVREYFNLSNIEFERGWMLMSEMRCGETTLRDMRSLAQTRDEDITQDKPSHGLRLR